MKLSDLKANDAIVVRSWSEIEQLVRIGQTYNSDCKEIGLKGSEVLYWGRNLAGKLDFSRSSSKYAEQHRYRRVLPTSIIDDEGSSDTETYPNKTFMEGVEVKVLRKADSYDRGWKHSWCQSMDKYVGCTGIVETCDGKFGVNIEFPDGYSWNFPHFILAETGRAGGGDKYEGVGDGTTTSIKKEGRIDLGRKPKPEKKVKKLDVKCVNRVSL